MNQQYGMGVKVAEFKQLVETMRLNVVALTHN
jgi:hypothetical protein